MLECSVVAAPLVCDVSEDGAESLSDVIHQMKQRCLVPLKEDLSDWINTLLDDTHVAINVDNFVTVLDSGVVLAQLANVITTRAQHSSHEGVGPGGSRVKYRSVSTSSSSSNHGNSVAGNSELAAWTARDNISNFLRWARQFGVKEECLFETEGLVSHRDERNVVLCLLEIARLANKKFNISAPTIVCMESEIEREENSIRQQTPAANTKPRPTSCVDLSTSGLRPQSRGSTPSGGRGRGGRGRGASSRAGRQSVSLSSSTDIVAIDNTDSKLDAEVCKVSGSCSCEQCFRVERLSQGRYQVGDRILFIRLLKGRHIMVRVGGGWDTLEHYLLQHDPCRMRTFEQSGSHQQFIHCLSRYKVT